MYRQLSNYLKNIHLIYIQLSNYLKNIHLIYIQLSEKYTSYIHSIIQLSDQYSLFIPLWELTREFNSTNNITKYIQCAIKEKYLLLYACGNVNQFQCVCGNICQSVQRYFYPNASSSISAIVTPCQSKSV